MNKRQWVTMCVCVAVATMSYGKPGGKPDKPEPVPVYRINYQGCDLEVGEGNGLIFTVTGEEPTVKIQYFKKTPKNVDLGETGINTETPGMAYFSADDPAFAFPSLTCDGPLQKLHTEAFIAEVTVEGSLTNVITKNSHVGLIEAAELGNVKMAGYGDMGQELYARTSIVTTNEETNGAPAMKVLLTGVILENLATAQNVNLIKAFTKKSKSKTKGPKGVALAGVGRIAIDPEDVDAVAASYEIVAPLIQRIQTKGAAISPDHIQTNSTIQKLQAISGKYNGQAVSGAIGFAEEGETAPVLTVLAENINVLSGENVYGVFLAGYDETDAPTYSGAIQKIETKAKRGVIVGKAYVAENTILFKGDASQFDVFTADAPEEEGTE